MDRRRRRRAHIDQHVRRVCGDPSHADDVPEIRRPENACQSRHGLLHRSHHPLHPQPRGLIQSGNRQARQLVRHRRHGDRCAGHDFRLPHAAHRRPTHRPADRHRQRLRLHRRRDGRRRRHRAVGGAHRAHDPDAGTRRDHALAGRLRRLHHRLRQLHRHFDGVCDPRRACGPRTRNLHRRADRRGDLHRLGDRVRQAVGEDQRQAGAAAGAPLAQPHGPPHRDRLRLLVPQRRIDRRRHAAARRHDGGLARLRRSHGDGDRRRRHAGGDLDAEQLLGLGGGGDRLHAVERPAHRGRRAGRLVGRNPQLHHVPRHEPQLPRGDRGRVSAPRKARPPSPAPRRRATSIRSPPTRPRSCSANPRA